MKIKPLHIQPIHAYTTTTKPNKKAPASSFFDKVEISSAAMDMRGTQSIEQARAEKVAQLKADVQSGAYKVDTRQVAQDMLNYYRF